MSALASALALAAQGVPCFPCNESKAPTCPRGFHAATAEPEALRDLWRRHPGTLIGVPTGPASGFDVLDVDPRHNGDAWLHEHATQLPPTRIHTTRSGGWHYLFRHHDGVRNSESKIAPGIDVRGEGGYVIAWPQAGLPVPSPGPVADWPAWLLAVLLPPPLLVAEVPAAPSPAQTRTRTAEKSEPPEAAIRLARHVLAKVETAPEGQRHPRLRAAARTIGGLQAQLGINDTDAAEELFAAVKRAGGDSVRDENAKATIASGLKKGAAEPLALANTNSARSIEPPAMSILNRSASPAPELPLEVFGDFWTDWIARTAEGANAPPDYVAMPLLAVTSSLLGNARWVVAWHGWAEPPALWCASVGNPSSGKSSGAAPVTRDVLGIVERHLARDYAGDIERWQTVASVAKAVLKQWEKDAAKAIKDKKAVPEKPHEATIPPKPIRPRARVADVTVEKLATIIEGLPKGVLYCRDELASWLLNLSRYANGGSDRPFWLESYVGGSMQVDRVKNPDPVFIPHLTVPVFGTIQPDRLGEVLAGADDGLPSRFLWSWPEARPFRRPIGAGDIEAAAGRLQALADLSMATDAGGDVLPHYVYLADDGREILADFAREMQDRETAAHGLLKSSLGKARGQALRLATVFEHLWWTGAGATGQPPAQVSRRAMQAAAGIMDAYFLPMALRVLGDASVPEDERHARTLAAWIVTTRPDRVNVSSIRDGARLPGLRESEPVKAACRFLAEAHWLSPADLTGAPGRPRGDYLVNPAVWATVP